MTVLCTPLVRKLCDEVPGKLLFVLLFRNAKGSETTWLPLTACCYMLRSSTSRTTHLLPELFAKRLLWNKTSEGTACKEQFGPISLLELVLNSSCGLCCARGIVALSKKTRGLGCSTAISYARMSPSLSLRQLYPCRPGQSSPGAKPSMFSRWAWCRKAALWHPHSSFQSKTCLV